jgi:hypothetical protein
MTPDPIQENPSEIDPNLSDWQLQALFDADIVRSQERAKAFEELVGRAKAYSGKAPMPLWDRPEEDKHTQSLMGEVLGIPSNKNFPPKPIEDVLSLALTNLLNHYLSLANSGDAGNWNPEEEQVVIEAREAIKLIGEVDSCPGVPFKEYLSVKGQRDHARHLLREIHGLGLGPDQGSTAWQAEQAHRLSSPDYQPKEQ